VNRKTLWLFPLMSLLAGCPSTSSPSGPPLERFYFPTSLVHVDVPGKTEGVLFVANANSDKRYATGSVVAVPLDLVGLPPLGTPVAVTDAGVPFVQQLTDLKLDASQNVQIASFAGELALQTVAPNAYRLYAPTRSEGMRAYQLLASVNAEGVPSLSCAGAETSQNCTGTGISLTPVSFDGIDAGVQWPFTPFGVTTAPRACSAASDCCAAGTACVRSCTAGQCVGLDNLPFADVWVTYSPRTDASTLVAGRALNGYVARLDSDDFTFKPENLVPIGLGGASSVAAFGPWVYVTGRLGLVAAPNLVRLVNRDQLVLSTSLESLFRVSDSRGVALSSDGKRLFVVGRVPDTLMVAAIDNPLGIPTLNFVRGVNLPDAPNAVQVIARPGRGDLVAITCTSAGSLALYDEDVGDLVATVSGLGAQPFGLAVDVRANAARIYVSNFGDGRIAVIDVPDLERPQGARLVARLGEQQVCLTRGSSSPNCLASKEVAQ